MASAKRKEPVHRLLYLCSTYTPDAAWSEFLRECSYGKFPRGVRFEDGALKCTRKKQTFSVPIPDDAEKAVQTIISVFRDKLGIKTNRETKSAAVRFDRQRVEGQIKTWKDASSAAAKTCLIRNFVSRFSVYYGLSPTETREMTLLLELALASKMIGSKNIVIADGKISQIQGLRFDPLTRKSTLDGECPQLETHPLAVPVDYKPVKQVNHEKTFWKLVDYHQEKVYQCQPQPTLEE